MKTVLILGITGTFGPYLAQALEKSDWQIKAMMREPRELPGFDSLQIVQGDAASYADVKRAAADVDMLVYGVNPANYDWEEKVVEWLDISARVAEENRLPLIFPGNVYNYNPNEASTVDENSPQNPITRKGELRKQMEQRLLRASENGAQIIIFRMGDYIAPNASSQAWISHIVKAKKNSIKVSSPGNVHLKRTWAYVPDAATTVARLCEKLDDLPRYNVFHFKGYQASITDIAYAISHVSDKPVSIARYPWWALNLTRPFMTVVKGLFEMRYLWNRELNLNDKKLKQFLTDIPTTPLQDALKQSCAL